MKVIGSPSFLWLYHPKHHLIATFYCLIDIQYVITLKKHAALDRLHHMTRFSSSVWASSPHFSLSIFFSPSSSPPHSSSHSSAPLPPPASAFFRALLKGVLWLLFPWKGNPFLPFSLLSFFQKKKMKWNHPARGKKAGGHKSSWNHWAFTPRVGRGHGAGSQSFRLSKTRVLLCRGRWVTGPPGSKVRDHAYQNDGFQEHNYT